MDYRSFLKEEFESRRHRNPKYSLRAYSRDLGLASSRLTEILKGRQGLSLERAQVLSRRLKFKKLKTKFFCDLVEREHGRSQAIREAAQSRLQRLEKVRKEDLSLDLFEAISHWPHFAFLSLLDLKEFSPELPWVARRLGIEEKTAQEVFERLQRLKLIELRRGRWRAVQNYFVSSEPQPSSAIQSFHRQILQKAIDSLSSQAPETREFSSTCLAVPKEQIPQAKKMIQNFVSEFEREISVEGRTQKVYSLSLQFFSLESE